MVCFSLTTMGLGDSRPQLSPPCLQNWETPPSPSPHMPSCSVSAQAFVANRCPVALYSLRGKGSIPSTLALGKAGEPEMGLSGPRKAHVETVFSAEMQAQLS